MAPVRVIGTDDLTETGSPSVVTIGVFDGVHAGHQAVISAASAAARAAGLPAVLVTFDRHPLSVTDPGRAPSLLTTLDEPYFWVGVAGQRTGAKDRRVLDIAPR